MNNQIFNDPERGGGWCFIATTSSSNLIIFDKMISGEISLEPSDNVKEDYWFKLKIPHLFVSKNK